MPTRDWLKEKHPIYEANEELWRRNERRLRGGAEVLAELVPFDWEKKDGDEYRARQAEATYINFPELHATIVAGHLLREAPAPGTGLEFGELGEVDTSAAMPSSATQIYGNVDSLGREGSQWDPWWLSLERRAMATGHRWILAEASTEAPRSGRDELLGRRPYLVEYSPLSVTNWDDEDGRLQFAIIRTRDRRVRLNERNVLTGNKYGHSYYLLVAEGYGGLGPEYEAGGWWFYGNDLEPLQRSPGEPMQGTWELTGGEIPLFPLFYDRDTGSEEWPSMSRAGLTSLGQVAVSYMNLSSGADFDAWDAAQGIGYLMGVSTATHKSVVAQILEGTKLAGVPLTVDADGKPHMPQLQDSSAGAVAAEVFDKRLANKWEEARVLAALEATGSPDTSGTSKQMSFQDIMGPRLANIAANLEAAQNAALHFLTLRWGKREAGAVSWPREFNLKDVLADINAMFGLETMVGAADPEFDAGLLVRAAEELALVADDSAKDALRSRFVERLQEKADQRAQAAAALAGAGVGFGAGEGGEEE